MNFNLANSFVTGIFPDYLLIPCSNLTDPGVYSLVLSLTDSHLINPLTKTYKIVLTVLSLPNLNTLFQIILTNSSQQNISSRAKNLIPNINSTNESAVIVTVNTTG
jgi:hypothetical protein